MITKLFFDEELEKHYNLEGNTNSLENLTRLNILIGANNSGKSRFLRKLFSERNFKVELSEFNAINIANIFDQIFKELDEKLGALGYEDIGSQNISGIKLTLRKHIDDLRQIEIQNINKVATDIITYWSWLKNFNATGASHKANAILLSGSLERPTKVVTDVLEKNRDRLNELLPEAFNHSLERVYIPILRGLRPTQFIDENKFDEIRDNYAKRTIRDYFKDTLVKPEEIFTGLRLYEDAKKMLLGKRDERNKIRNFETFLSQTFFDSKGFTLIPNIEDDSLHVSIGSEEWPIYKLGDGIQSLIILLYPLFFNQGKKMLVFIEEPENSMHPGLQRLFIETLMLERFSSFQYFITTHSNHFLDLTLDVNKISIYTFNKFQSESDSETVYRIENSSNEDTNVLDLIGVRNSSVFLSNCTIWVEGITDRLYIKKYLEIYQSHLKKEKGEVKFREDSNYSFVEYGGSNITHWTFGDEDVWDKIRANKISSKIFLIADKDSTDAKPNSEKAKRLSFLQEVLKDRFQIIDGKEIENILTPSILIKSVEILEKKNFSNVTFNESSISKTNYLNKPIGKFISSSFSNLKRRYEADSGTIFCKIDFCRAAIESIKNIKDLSPEALNLTSKIYDFIFAANQNT